MIWFFVILGLAVLTAALHGLVLCVMARSSAIGLHGAVIALVLVAWKFGHSSAGGWIALAVAGLFEFLLSRMGSQPPPANKEGPAVREPEVRPLLTAPNETPPVEAIAATVVAPIEPEPITTSCRTPGRTLTSWALLQTPWDGAVDVFVASLRRGGRRDARKIGTSEVQIGSSTLSLEPVSDKVPGELWEDALAQSWDWPEAALNVAAHVCYAKLTSTSPQTVSCSEMVQLHLFAHAALSEFASVGATLWPDARRLIQPGHSADTPAELLNACVSFRTFPLAAARTLCDTAGLHAFALPDLQITCEGEPDEFISRLLYHLAEQVFRDGCNWTEGEVIRFDGREDWSAHLDLSRFPPERSVIDLRRRQNDS